MALSPIANKRIIWGIRFLLAVVFGAAGLAKLAGAEQMVSIFTQIGFGQWFRVVTGITEVAGAILLLVPATGFYGGLLLTATMVCGAATHLFLIGGSPIPAAILGALSAFVAIRLRPNSAIPLRA